MGGSNTWVRDFSAVSEFNSICDDLGMDTISTGSAISWAMECSKMGLIKEKIPFGDGRTIVELAKKIAYRKGVGNLLAEGVARAAEKLGREAKEVGVHVKGMEAPGYDPRGTVSMALAYATSDRGACHLRAWPVGRDAFGELDPYSIENKAEIVIEEQNKNSAKWSLIACNFTGYTPKDAVEFLKEVTGYNITEEEYLAIGERIFNLTRLFNVREGFSRKDDSLPERFERPLKGGITEGHKINRKDFEEMLDEYYERRGWSKRGVPKKETLKT